MVTQLHQLDHHQTSMEIHCGLIWSVQLGLVQQMLSLIDVIWTRLITAVCSLATDDCGNLLETLHQYSLKQGCGFLYALQLINA